MLHVSNSCATRNLLNSFLLNTALFKKKYSFRFVSLHCLVIFIKKNRILMSLCFIWLFSLCHWVFIFCIISPTHYTFLSSSAIFIFSFCKILVIIIFVFHTYYKISLYSFLLLSYLI